jgi:hypothetical protein
MYVILILILFTSCVESNDNELVPIAHLGGTEIISGGWSKLTIETAWDDKILFSYHEDKGEFNEISISNDKYSISINKKYLNLMKKPDLGTLSDVWFMAENHNLYKFDFEFNQFYFDGMINKGRFKVEFIFKENKIQNVHIDEYSPYEDKWHFKFDLVSKLNKKKE